MKKVDIVESLYIEPAVAEHVEMYLKAVWLIDEAGEKIAHISTISKALGVAPPSVVQMLKKMEGLGYVKYLRRRGAEMTNEGRTVGRRMVRNGRLIETFMSEKLHTAIDTKIACGIEHHLTDEFAGALCTFLGHPKKCPHKKPIPEGRCCARRS